MRKFLSLSLVLLTLAALTGCMQKHSAIDPELFKPFSKPTKTTKGLVIVGGALEASNVNVYGKFIEMAGGSKAKIGVIPVASGRPAKYAKMVQDELAGYGFKNVVVIPLAVKDDKGTEGIDETKWAENVDKDETVELIKSCTGIWFTGGDQRRTTGLMYREDGSKTKSLEAVWEVYNRGGVIGGTSAGAAIMCDPMIAAGDGWGGFVQPVSYDNLVIDENLGPVGLMRGIGFFDKGMVDQHFGKRGRIGRLYAVMMELKDKFELGFGVDENTAMIYYPETNEIEAQGRGGVYIMDVKHAQKMPNNGARNILLSIIEKGDKYNLDTRVVTPNPLKIQNDGLQVVGAEYNSHEAKPKNGLGTMMPYLNDALGWDLLDNKVNDQIRHFLFDENFDGAEIIFTKITEDTILADEFDDGAYFGGYDWGDVVSQGYWNFLDGTLDQYTIVNVAMEVKPIKVSVKYKN